MKKSVRKLGWLPLLLLGAAGAASAADWAAGAAAAWEIGPIIRGRNYSVNMPLHPAPSARGWSFDFPAPNARAGHVHYVTIAHGPLAGKSRIVARYRIDAARGARLLPQEAAGQPALLSLYFSRSRDNWSASGPYEHFRWYGADQTVRQLAPGEYEISARLQPQDWVSLAFKPGTENPRAFQDALSQTDRVGLVFGWPGGRGHGVYATAPARFTLLSFSVN